MHARTPGRGTRPSSRRSPPPRRCCRHDWDAARARPHEEPLIMATENASTRVLWRGAISFGLVHIPVGLHTATNETGLDFDWLDQRSMDPVGYKRVNKRTGKEIEKN